MKTIIFLLIALTTISIADSEIVKIITEEAIAARVHPEILIGICTVESNLRSHVTNFNEGNGFNSHGLCQLQLPTARFVGFKGDVKELYNPRTNAKYAARYLRYQLMRYSSWVHAVAAYNSGKTYFKNGKLINQTYVNKVRKIVTKKWKNNANKRTK